MEIYGMGNRQRGTEHLLDESAIGYIDPCSARSCYSEGKRAAENLCVSYHSEYQVPVKAVRLAQTFGSGILATTSACSRRSHATPPARTSS